VIVALLWHWKILPLFIKGVGRVLSKILGIKGPIATAGAASLFLGMVETPLVIRAYLNAMTKTELFSVMTLGMSTIAGSVLVLYSSILGGVTDAAIGQIIAASIMNIVGAFYISQIFFPELTQVHRREPAILSLSYDSTMDALTKGTRDGVNLAVNVGAMVLVLVSLVALVNGILGNFEIFGAQITLQRLLGWFFSPIAWLIGIPWPEAGIAGSLLGTKLVLNELVAYIQLSEVSPLLSEHSRVVMVFALCGFANFGSLGILLGGLYFLIPERQDEVVVMAPKSIASGTMVTLMTGSIVSLVISF
jgi:CNT family concentrative nucleoside transporter